MGSTESDKEKELSKILVRVTNTPKPSSFGSSYFTCTPVRVYANYNRRKFSNGVLIKKKDDYSILLRRRRPTGPKAASACKDFPDEAFEEPWEITVGKPFLARVETSKLQNVKNGDHVELFKFRVDTYYDEKTKELQNTLIAEHAKPQNIMPAYASPKIVCIKNKENAFITLQTTAKQTVNHIKTTIVDKVIDTNCLDHEDAAKIRSGVYEGLNAQIDMSFVERLLELDADLAGIKTIQDAKELVAYLNQEYSVNTRITIGPLGPAFESTYNSDVQTKYSRVDLKVQCGDIPIHVEGYMAGPVVYGVNEVLEHAHMMRRLITEGYLPTLMMGEVNHMASSEYTGGLSVVPKNVCYDFKSVIDKFGIPCSLSYINNAKTGIRATETRSDHTSEIQKKDTNRVSPIDTFVKGIYVATGLIVYPVEGKSMAKALIAESDEKGRKVWLIPYFGLDMSLNTLAESVAKFRADPANIVDDDKLASTLASKFGLILDKRCMVIVETTPPTITDVEMEIVQSVWNTNVGPTRSASTVGQKRKRDDDSME